VEKPLNNKNRRFNVKMMLFGITLFILLSFTLCNLAFGKFAPDAVVNYYGKILTEPELQAEVDDFACAVIPMPTIEHIFRQISRQTILMCFDSLYEANEWLRSRSIVW
jgi:hypothetical protein